MHGTYPKKNFLIWVEKVEKKDDEHFANHLQMYVSKTFTKANKSVLCAEYPSNELKIPFIKMENMFFTIYW